MDGQVPHFESDLPPVMGSYSKPANSDLDLPPEMGSYSKSSADCANDPNISDNYSSKNENDGNGKVEGVENEWDCQFTFDLVWSKTDSKDKLNEYLILKTLGDGSFARVKLAERQAGEKPYKKYAIKMMSKIRLRNQRDFVRTEDGGMEAHTALDKVQQEIEIMRHLWHRNVILLFEVLEDFDNEEELCLVLEYMPNGPSMRYIKEEKAFRSPITDGVLPEELAKSHFRDLLKGLAYLHEKGIIHRDIKPENLLLTEENTLRISDFGCAVQLDDQHRENGMVYDNAGTYYFFSPECCSGEGYSGYSNDLWAATVCLYIFLYGILPFREESYEPLFRQIQNENPDLPMEGNSNELSEVLQNLFLKDPLLRMQVKQVLEHAWLAESNNIEEKDEGKQSQQAEIIPDDAVTF